MKRVLNGSFRIFFLIPMLSFFGCATYHSVKEYKSYEQFSADFNEKIKNEELKITLTNDSSFITKENVFLKGYFIYGFSTQ